MTVELSPEVEKYVQAEVDAGHFASTKEAVEAGIARLMIDGVDELDAEDFEHIRRSLAQMDEGKLIDAQELHARIRSRYVNR